jgi:hypothetical protein
MRYEVSANALKSLEMLGEDEEDDCTVNIVSQVIRRPLAVDSTLDGPIFSGIFGNYILG